MDSLKNDNSSKNDDSSKKDDSLNSGDFSDDATTSEMTPKPPRIGADETRRVSYFKVLVVIVLMAAAAATTGYVYHLEKRDERNRFETEVSKLNHLSNRAKIHTFL